MRDSRVSGVMLIALLLLLWQLSAMYLVTSPTWPTVTRIFEAWLENIVDGTLAMHLLATFWRQMLGYGLAVVLGIALGLVMGYYRVLYNLFEPIVEVLRPIPGPAYLPVLVLFVGIGHEMKVVLILLASLFPILLNTYSGVRSIDRVQFDTARTLGLTTLQTFRELVHSGRQPADPHRHAHQPRDLADPGDSRRDDRFERRARLLRAAVAANLQSAGNVCRDLHPGDLRLCPQPHIPADRGRLIRWHQESSGRI